ncbi:MAG TPA: response regulator transcription factor [Prolixibacteraceae bacterium]|nr:response regulator transcription factor [Prolixibacteraceae bacterium]
MRVFVVEDELIHLEAIKIAIEEAGLELAGECNDADDAFDLIKKAMPDVLLVDIALPGWNNGITLAKKVHGELGIPHIFTTSFTQDEIIQQAVATHPAGYLRKPVDPVNLKAAVQLALSSRAEEAKTSPVSSTAETVYAKIGDKLVRVNIAEIILVKADGENCISLVLEKREIACRTTLKEFARQLPSRFIQVHRAYYINLDHLDSFNEREQTAVLKGHSAPVARNFRKGFLNSIRKV